MNYEHLPFKIGFSFVIALCFSFFFFVLIYNSRIEMIRREKEEAQKSQKEKESDMAFLQQLTWGMIALFVLSFGASLLFYLSR